MIWAEMWFVNLVTTNLSQNIAFKIKFASCILYLFEEIRLYGSLILEKTKHMMQSGHALKKIIIIYHAIQAAGDKGDYIYMNWFGLVCDSLWDSLCSAERSEKGP